MRWGRNSRLDNLQAALLRAKLKRVDQEIERRRAVARRYHQALAELDEIEPPPPPTAGGERFDTYQNYEIEADQRDALKAHLGQVGVGTIIQWGGKGVHQHEALGIDQRLPRTERMFERALLLPMNTSLTDDEVDFVNSCIREFYAAS